MKHLLVLTLALSCCASSKDWNISPVQAPKPTVGYAEDVKYSDVLRVINRISWKLGNTRHYITLRDWRYSFMDTWIVVENKETGEITLADGYTDTPNKHVFVYIWQPCVAASSIVHEMIHALGYHHDDKLMWHNLPAIHKEIANEICGPQYKTWTPPPPSPELLRRINKRQKELIKR